MFTLSFNIIQSAAFPNSDLRLASFIKDHINIAVYSIINEVETTLGIKYGNTMTETITNRLSQSYSFVNPLPLIQKLSAAFGFLKHNWEFIQITHEVRMSGKSFKSKKYQKALLIIFLDYIVFYTLPLIQQQEATQELSKKFFGISNKVTDVTTLKLVGDQINDLRYELDKDRGKPFNLLKSVYKGLTNYFSDESDKPKPTQTTDPTNN